MAELLRKDLARLLGLTASQVTRDAQAGMPTHSVDAARAWREANKRARVSPPPRAGRGGPPEGATAAGPPVLPDPPAEEDYWASRARREKAEADLAELKLQEQQGVLVRVADVKSGYAKRLAALREGLLQLPARLAPVLAAEADMAKCHEALQRELHAVLAMVTEG